MRSENKKERKPWEQYFMEIAHKIASRHTCDRAAVGAVILRDKNILSTGYNGSPAGLPHCDKVGHDLVDGHCIRAVHAEINAISQAAKHGVSTKGATIFITHFPCFHCFKSIINSGISEVYYDISYKKDERVLQAAELLSLKIHRVKLE
ncbi:cytidine/deoxycytidylate deaminase family protein [Candidatus Riflebacteria bacterium]